MRCWKALWDWDKQNAEGGGIKRCCLVTWFHCWFWGPTSPVGVTLLLVLCSVSVLWCTGSRSYCPVSEKRWDVPMSSSHSSSFHSLSCPCPPTSSETRSQLWLECPASQSLREAGWQREVYGFAGIYVLTRGCWRNVLLFPLAKRSVAGGVVTLPEHDGG